MSKRVDPRKAESTAAPDFRTPKHVIDSLKAMYMEKLRPIEASYKFGEVWTRSSRAR